MFKPVNVTLLFIEESMEGRLLYCFSPLPVHQSSTQNQQGSFFLSNTSQNVIAIAAEEDMMEEGEAGEMGDGGNKMKDGGEKVKGRWSK